MYYLSQPSGVSHLFRAVLKAYPKAFKSAFFFNLLQMILMIFLLMGTASKQKHFLWMLISMPAASLIFLLLSLCALRANHLAFEGENYSFKGVLDYGLKRIGLLIRWFIVSSLMLIPAGIVGMILERLHRLKVPLPIIIVLGACGLFVLYLFLVFSIALFATEEGLNIRRLFLKIRQLLSAHYFLYTLCLVLVTTLAYGLNNLGFIFHAPLLDSVIRPVFYIAFLPISNSIALFLLHDLQLRFK
jgi:hypothetical protein